MVLVDVHFSNGTVRLDLSQAAIDFYRKQGVRVELVDVTPETLKMTQIRFPVASTTFEGINGEVGFTGSGNFVFRILVFDLTSNKRTEQKKNFTAPRNVSYIIGIPAGSTRARIELQGFTLDGLPASNVFNQSFIKTPDEPTPITFKNCVCCGKTVRIPATEPCPFCGTCEKPPAPSLAPNIFDKGIIALLAVAALMPRGKKK